MKSLFCSPLFSHTSKEESVNLLAGDDNPLFPRMSMLSMFLQCTSFQQFAYQDMATPVKPSGPPTFHVANRIVVSRPGQVIIRNASEIDIEVVDGHKQDIMLFYPTTANVVILQRHQQKIKFSCKSLCLHSPLARQLMKLRGISKVTFYADCIKVKKHMNESSVTWAYLKPLVLATLIQFFSTDLQAVSEYGHRRLHYHTSQGECVCEPLRDETEAVLDDLINTRLRPAVQEEGGDVIFKEFVRSTGEVHVYLYGTCLSNPQATKAIKNAIHCLLQYHVPGVTSVVEVPVRKDGRKRATS